MKKIETINRMKRNLFKIAEDPGFSKEIKNEAWLMATALQWASEKADWSLFEVFEEKQLDRGNHD